jgi:hypothetical protein
MCDTRLAMMAKPIEYERRLPRRSDRELSLRRVAIGVVVGFALLIALFIASAVAGTF